VNIPLFSQLNGCVIHTALQKLYYKLELSRRPDYPPLCTCKTPLTMGYPCGHDLQQLEAAGEAIPLSRVHRHWWLGFAQADQPLPLPEPVIQLPQRQHCGRQDSSESSSQATATRSEAESLPAIDTVHHDSESENNASTQTEPSSEQASPWFAAQPFHSQQEQASTGHQRLLRSGKFLGQLISSVSTDLCRPSLLFTAGYQQK
jgi:hypothetical protein